MLIQYQILKTNITRTVWQTVRRIMVTVTDVLTKKEDIFIIIKQGIVCQSSFSSLDC